jgi:hypothetical protein
VGLAFGGAGFLQVDAHDDFEFVLEGIAQGQQLFAVLDLGVHVMQRRRSPRADRLRCGEFCESDRETFDDFKALSCGMIAIDLSRFSL